jgi:hypothetical protein
MSHKPGTKGTSESTLHAVRSHHSFEPTKMLAGVTMNGGRTEHILLIAVWQNSAIVCSSRLMGHPVFKNAINKNANCNAVNRRLHGPWFKSHSA